MPHALLICGSLAQNAHTLALLQYTEQRLQQAGWTTLIWNLRQTPLPMVDPAYHHDPHLYPDAVVQRFIECVQQADAIIVGSPNYHNSYSGVLKNALDWTNMDIFKQKVVGLMANGGGLRSTQPLDHLRIVIRGLLGLAIPAQVAACNSDFVIENESYLLQNPDIILRVNTFVEQLITYSSKFIRNESTK